MLEQTDLSLEQLLKIIMKPRTRKLYLLIDKAKLLL